MVEGNLGLPAKKRYYSKRRLHPVLAAYYYQEFGNAHRILDLGCGLGHIGKFKPEPAIEVYGLDIDSEVVAKAKEYEKAQVWDLERPSLPFDEEYFDAVLAKDILEHVQKPWVLVMEICRVLRPGGIVIASVAMAKPEVVWNDYTHVRGFTRNALRMMFEDNGFKTIHIKRMGAVPLTGRLNLIRWMPLILKFPLFGLLFGRSWEIKTCKTL